MGKFEIETDDLVYIPSDDTFLLAENLEIKKDKVFLKLEPDQVSFPCMQVS